MRYLGKFKWPRLSSHPAAPTDGEAYKNINDGNVYDYDATKSTWRNLSRQPPSTTIQYNMPNNTLNILNSAGTVELGGTNYRQKIDFSDIEACRLQVNVTAAGGTGSFLKLQYSLNNTTWTDFGLQLGLNSTGLLVSSWINTPPSAKNDVYIRFVSNPGTGLLQLMSLNAVYLQTR